MSLTIPQWHKRYLLQAEWTHQIRKYLFTLGNIKQTKSILEVGCGTGAVLFQVASNAQLVGIDIDVDRLKYANEASQLSFELSAGDAHLLPFKTNSFDITYCHYLLLWLDQPEIAIKEMVRVTKPGGVIIAFAEPDFAHRIDYPTDLQQLGKLQRKALIAQGANPDIGQIILELFTGEDIFNITTGLLKYDNKNQGDRQRIELELAMIQEDLIEYISREDNEKYYNNIIRMDNLESLIFYIPTFYAIGVKEKL